MHRHVSTALRAAIALVVFFALTGLHGKGDRGKNKKNKGKGNRPPTSPPVSKAITETKKDLEDNGAPAGKKDTDTDKTDEPPKEKTPPKKPKFKFDEDMVNATWEKHRPGGMYDSMKPPKKNNVFHKDFTKDDLRKMLQEAQEHGVERPRGVNSTDIMRGGKYVYYNPYTGKPTGHEGQTGLLIPIAGDGNMKSAYPFES